MNWRVEQLIDRYRVVDVNASVDEMPWLEVCYSDMITARAAAIDVVNHLNGKASADWLSNCHLNLNHELIRLDGVRIRLYGPFNHSCLIEQYAVQSKTVESCTLRAILIGFLTSNIHFTEVKVQMHGPFDLGVIDFIKALPVEARARLFSVHQSGRLLDIAWTGEVPEAYKPDTEVSVGRRVWRMGQVTCWQTSNE
jgi:hypothetical protein